MEEIPQQMKILLDKFDKLRGKSPRELGVPFWDLVVLTASDEAQKEAYELQVQDKLARAQLPTDVHYLVYADPPGTRAGAGTSSMFVITQLEEKFGRKQLHTWRILLLNAGGMSQRLPSASALGKIFTALPINGYQMLDLKMAMYLPFLERMSPGYFHPASDCIELYAMDVDDVWNFTEPGITALAHPSSLSIGTGHGVYVLQEEEGKKDAAAPRRKTEFRTCLKVLQKPSEAWMREEGAVLQDGQQNEFVYTDSVFFFDHPIATKLADFYREHAPLQCEIDSYADFLQPLGPRATIDYTNNTANVGKVEPKLVETRQMIFHLLKGTPLHIVALNASKFYHYGTFDEYLFHVTEDKTMAAELNFSRVVNSRITESQVGKGDQRNGEVKQIEGCVMHSLLASGSHIPTNSIAEYAHFTVPLKLGSKCVISNCQYTPVITTGALSEIQVPDNMFLHTASINHNGKTQFVTVIFDIRDNLKKTLPLPTQVVMQRPLREVIQALSLDHCVVYPGKAIDEKVSLWTAKLFPVAETMTASLETAVEMICKVHKIQNDEVTASTNGAVKATDLMSMADIIECKNISCMLDFRNQLCQEILQL